MLPLASVGAEDLEGLGNVAGGVATVAAAAGSW
uniref:Uncharacterized protein n=1 Tax=Arundo donax TaxID=35708 RepID=A0A0A9A871_ARUDO